MLKNWSCATRGRELCQVGNQAALSDLSGVPRGCLFGASRAVNVCKSISTEGCMALFGMLKIYAAYAEKPCVPLALFLIRRKNVRI